ncbi:hypothetical protein [Nocardioides daejeonensis]|uniref:hypothetical protein n=1 Tax=Nocardioides daejeonensis TaxID=1046556 RepID=UPI000D74760C|nr:hypothetical protein [Nocardioides daejeonensis]
MYGESATMRKRARELQEQAGDLRALADSLVGQVETISWQGRAASDLRNRIADRAARLRDCAEQHEIAADALTRHLTAVDGLKDTIGNLERRAGALVAEARTRAQHVDHGSGVVVEPSDEDRALLAFTPPPSGHKDWLTVTIPGL